MQVIMRRHKLIPHHPRTAKHIFDSRSEDDSTNKTLRRFREDLVKTVRQEPVLPKQKPLDLSKEGITLMSPVGYGKEGLF